MIDNIKPIAIIGAMTEEVTAYLENLLNARAKEWHEFTFYRGMLFGQQAVLVKSGVGKVFAALVTQHLIDSYQPRAVVFTGVAGGLNDKLTIGDIVVGTSYVQHDVWAEAIGFERGQIPYSSYREFLADPGLVTQALKTNSSGQKIMPGRILSGDQFISNSHCSEFNYLRTELKGDAVEMEGAAVAQVCVVNRVPFVVVRTISDRADDQAVVDFKTFLPQVVANSLAVVKQIMFSY